MKKILTVILTLTLLLSVFALTAFAAEENTLETEEVNVFESVYSFLIKNSDKLLSLFSALASLLLAFLYKRGLLPLLRGSISKLNSTVSDMKEASEKNMRASHEDTAIAKKSLDDAEALFRSLEERLASLEQTLILSAEEKEERKNLRTVVKTQIDMLYEVFMSSSLPVYLKESIAEKISEMKKEMNTSSSLAPVTHTDSGETQNG